jgi:uncharacterized protein (TIGR03086 family)
MDDIDEARRVVADARDVLATVTAADLGRSTPCAAWDVRALADHMIGMCLAFTDAFEAAGARAAAGDDAPAPPEPSGVVPSAGDLDAVPPVDRYAEASDATLVAWADPGWRGQVLVLPFGSLPAEIAVRVFIGDQLIHTWDLATALGRSFTMDLDLATTQLELMRRFYDPANRGPYRSFDLATEVAVTASVQDQLIALSGRTL